ncbi:YjfK family protein [Pseudomonas moraviensis]|uniref:YjfK family protein n=1 Tax=Pseudomonas moraviensis TaxID=321662 RepID=UPI00215EC350|nr:YjfK family protein [Pseudomonas moraviensis]UVL45610.1 YjfK family protein [Pseudomonas moraviensis]
MGWFKDLLGTSTWQTAAPTTTGASGPLGMAQGKGVRFDTTLALLLEGSTSVRVPFDQAVWSAGWVDLGQSNKLHRYYMNDEDFWVQIHVTGEDQIESVTLFNYLSYVTVNSDAELRRLAGPNSLIGLPTYTRDGVEYTREWGTELQQTELVPMTEHVVNPDESYTIKHHAMLYARDTGLTDRRELLLFSVEQDEEGTVSLSTSLGISLYTTDLSAI